MNNITRTKSDKIFDTFNVIFFMIIVLLIIYPLYFMIIASFSDPGLVNTGNVWLWPKNVTLEGYRVIFQNDQIWTGYKNSIIYTVVGTTINVILTIAGGYALSRKDLIGRNYMMFFITFTMFFSGGLIPTYLLVRDLGLVNTMWALIIPGAVSAYNLIIVKTFFEANIPDELLEAGIMDGCSNMTFFLKIAIPLSKPIIAVMILFHAVGHWNQYFAALIYIRDASLYPLQLVLREILIVEQSRDLSEVGAAILDDTGRANIASLIQYGVIIVASVPMLVLYPFVQKHFVKGVMIGSIKG